MKQVKKILFKLPITVDFDNEEEDVSIDELEQSYARFEAEFSREMFDDCIQQTAEDLIDELDMLENDEPLAARFDKLVKDLHLEHVIVYADAFLLFLVAPTIFPDDEIIIQLNSAYEIEEMEVEDEHEHNHDDAHEHAPPHYH